MLSIPDAKKAVVIYHFPCMDGFAAAWAFHELKEKDYGSENVTYVPANYGKHPSQLLESWPKPCDIYVLDFSFSREVIVELADICLGKVILLDHHKTAQADLENWEDKPANVEIVFDMNRSGAKITWDYFKPKDSDPDIAASWGNSALVDYVSDRDLWKFALEQSKSINAVVANTPYAFKNYKELDEQIACSWESVVRIGDQLSAQHQKFCEEMAQDARPIHITHPETGEIFTGLAVNTTYQFASEVGNILAKKSGTYGATYYSDKTGAVKFSLRSIGDFDVSAIAKFCGGGGHKNASGFILHPNETDRTDTIKLWTLGSEGGMR